MGPGEHFCSGSFQCLHLPCFAPTAERPWHDQLDSLQMKLHHKTCCPTLFSRESAFSQPDRPPEKHTSAAQHQAGAPHTHHGCLLMQARPQAAGPGSDGSAAAAAQSLPCSSSTAPQLRDSSEPAPGSVVGLCHAGFFCTATRFDPEYAHVCHCQPLDCSVLVSVNYFSFICWNFGDFTVLQLAYFSRTVSTLLFFRTDPKCERLWSREGDRAAPKLKQLATLGSLLPILAGETSGSQPPAC